VAVVVVESELADAVTVSVEFDEAVAVVASLAVDAAVEVAADEVVVAVVVDVVSVLVLAAVDVAVVVVVVLVLADESLDSDEQMLEKPLASSYTFTSRPLVGTSSVQSGGFSDMMDAMSDWQSLDAHMSTYSASVGSDVEYRRL
jgi:hypothetical protein